MISSEIFVMTAGTGTGGNNIITSIISHNFKLNLNDAEAYNEPHEADVPRRDIAEPPRTESCYLFPNRVSTNSKHDNINV